MLVGGVLYDVHVYPFPWLSASFIFIITYKVCCFRVCCVVLQGWYFKESNEWNVWYFHNVFCFVSNVFQRYRGGGGGGEGRGGLGRRAEEEEVSLGVIMTNTEIKFHILLFTLSSSSVSQSLSFNFLQSLYCPLSSVLALCLQIKVWSCSVLSIRKDSGSLLSS